MKNSTLIANLTEKIRSIKLRQKRKIIPIPPEISQSSENSIRQTIAQKYLKGEGIEIGALNNPLKLPHSVKVKYLDKYPFEKLKIHDPNFKTQECVNVDIFDDGEKLESLKDSSVDFVIANHFIEHCENPIKAFENMIRVIKSSGILFLSIPDKRFIFDRDRPITSMEHIIKDYNEGPQYSKRLHYEEWVKYLGTSANLSGVHYDDVSEEVDHLMKIDYSIHYHVWTQKEFLEYILLLKKMFNTFELELFIKNNTEVVVVIRKN
ncbi:Methyltransferase domain protein [uncultured archaeon]|nr:Methyltransferase domain protein [uncultured archaeon]